MDAFSWTHLCCLYLQLLCTRLCHPRLGWDRVENSRHSTWERNKLVLARVSPVQDPALTSALGSRARQRLLGLYGPAFSGSSLLAG